MESEKTTEYSTVIGDTVIDVEYAMSGNSKRYTLATKIAISKFAIASSMPHTKIGEVLDVHPTTLGLWIKDYKDGKFSLNNATSISRKPIRTASIIMEEVKRMEIKVESLQNRIKVEKEEAKRLWEQEKIQRDKEFAEL